MRTLSTLLLAALCFASCATKSVVIDGTIKDFNPETELTLIAVTPEAGFSWAFRDTINVDSLGRFRVEMGVEDAAFVAFQVRYDNKYEAPLFIVEEGESYGIDIDLASSEILVDVTGVNKEGVELIQTYPKENVRAWSVIDSYAKDTTLDGAVAKVNRERDEALATLKQLHDTQKISAQFYELAVVDRHTYYNGLMASIVSSSFDGGQEGSPEAVAYMNEALSGLSEIKYIASSWWNQLAEIAIDHEINLMAQDSTVRDSIMAIARAGDGSFNTFKISIAQKLFPDNELLESITGYTIWYAGIQKDFEKGLIDDFAQFKADFPNSQYIEYITPYIVAIEEYHAKISGDFSEKVKFVEDYASLNTLEEVIAQFKGKKLYIDVWATWCGPCKDQFKYGAELKELLAEKGVEMLYISVDRDRNEQRWNENIKFFELYGNHIRTNRSLHENIAELCSDDKGMFGIPTYIIVDETGTIITKNAPRPSELDELRKAL